jgi:hypothetical protein
MAEIRPDLSDERSRIDAARPTARVERDPALTCVHCNEHIDTSRKYDALLPAHIRCWYANLPKWSPVSRDPCDTGTRVFRQQISMVGYVVLPLESFRGEHDHGTWTMEDPTCTAIWDLPGSLYWVKVARTRDVSRRRAAHPPTTGRDAGDRTSVTTTVLPSPGSHRAAWAVPQIRGQATTYRS